MNEGNTSDRLVLISREPKVKNLNSPKITAWNK